MSTKAEQETATAASQKCELRLALAMRGGVSLAVWIGGACAEIDSLRWASSVPADQDGDIDEAEREARAFWREVLKESKAYDRVVVDVLAGASAGGLNGVLFAAAIRHGFSMGQLLPIWQEVASVPRLLRKEGPHLSLFDGDRAFRKVLTRRLGELIKQGSPNPPDAPYVDLRLSATLVEPLDIAAMSPQDEKLRRWRSSARFHFRHESDSAVPRCDLDADRVPALAAAARATASFPVAFEAAVVRAERPEAFRLNRGTPQPTGEEGVADSCGTFSEARSCRGDTGVRPSDFTVMDGGVVDNIPIGKATDAIRDAPASKPTTRVLVYLHPTGPSGPADQDDPAFVKTSTSRAVAQRLAPTGRAYPRRGPEAILRGCLAARLPSEAIDQDVEQIEAHNRKVALAQLLRSATAADVAAAVAPQPNTAATLLRSLARRSVLLAPLLQSATAADVAAVVDARRITYRVMRTAMDIDDHRTTLREPLEALGDDPFPVPPRRQAELATTGRVVDTEDRWRAPLALWPPDARHCLDEKLRSWLEKRLNPGADGVLTTGLGPLSRCTRLLVEWVRGQEGNSKDARAFGSAKRDLYRVSALLHELERVRRIGWITAAGVLCRENDDERANLSAADVMTWVETWVDETCHLLENLLQVDVTSAEGILAGLGTGSPEAFRAYLDHCGKTFDRLAEMTQPNGIAEAHVESFDGGCNLRDHVVAHVGGIIGPLLAKARSPDRDCPTWLLHRVLDASGANVATRLEWLEVLCLPEFASGWPGGSAITFARMSAAARTVDAEEFRILKEWSNGCSSVKNVQDDKRVKRLSPSVKLAGNELASFSAFLDKRWRTNDWTWGRSDSVPTLVRLLLDNADAPAPPDEWDDRVGKRQAQIFEDARRDHAMPTRAEWDVGLQTLTEPGSSGLHSMAGDLGAVAGHVVADALPPPLPRLHGPLSRVLSGVVRRLATPRGWPNGSSEKGPRRPPDAPPPRRGGPLPVVILGLFGFGALVAAVVWAIAANPWSLLIGALAGLLPGSAALWLSTSRLAARRWIWNRFLPGVVVGLLLAGVVVGIGDLDNQLSEAWDWIRDRVPS